MYQSKVNAFSKKSKISLLICLLSISFGVGSNNKASAATFRCKTHAIGHIRKHGTNEKALLDAAYRSMRFIELSTLDIERTQNPRIITHLKNLRADERQALKRFLGSENDFDPTFEDVTDKKRGLMDPVDPMPYFLRIFSE